MQAQFEEIPEKTWHRLLSPNYKIPSLFINLTPAQATHLIESETNPKAEQFLDGQQLQAIKEEIEKSQETSLFPKVNGRIPRDLQHQITRKISKPQELMQILTTSEYILENIHKGQQIELVLRHFFPYLGKNQGFYQVIVRDGYVLGIGQKYCDHIEQEPKKQIIGAIFTAVQDSLPIVGITSQAQEHLKLILFSIYCAKEGEEIRTKITSIRRISENQGTNIFSPQELKQYFAQIESHKSEEDFYFENEEVIPLVKTILKKQDIRQADMGEYMLGNELDSADKVEEWKNFIKQSNQKFKQNESQ